MRKIDMLLERIEFLRNEMAKVAFKKGFTSKESIIISQELDKLLNLYDSVLLNETKNSEHN
ncbi:Spo0E family sporulation regulatory protein-aspartic acid phosphatase [Virgibacillus phasianinus]|uniref:Spo0E family sporulation regulatory protein-aspartic acid phosphatase n=2 Tax=Virgibacillus phasianinus TaxID=2017483 RepID=A0A220U968_9BACI|nr:aspartyl-phosphate phosphatase Spo0E family protein [Virgibacillus phasianinus]ASK64446.1 Spo0E family sporulation regulatory protein-aspartic acid phosphatase [Virgibacillus phasianinus]